MATPNGIANLSLVIVAAMQAACSDAVTSVRLQVATAPGLAPDGLAVSIDGSRHEQAMTDSLQLLVPDDWAGRAKRIEVEGTSSGATVAIGGVVVTPIAGREVTATVMLFDARCGLVCDVGELRCEGDGFVSCEIGADGCPQWSSATACPSGAPFCSNGTCSDTCVDECTSGATTCELNGSVRTCGQADSDSCLDWSSPIICPGAQLCDGDACTANFSGHVDAGGETTCWLKTDHTVVCWGLNEYGQATAPAASFVDLSVGEGHACGVKTDGSVACWGDDSWLQASAPIGMFASVSAGGDHTCGIKTDGSVACWGNDFHGQSTPPVGAFASVSAGRAHSCGIKADGSVACWGELYYGQSTPPGGTFANLSAGDSHTCGVKIDGSVACWGENASGQASPPVDTFANVSAGSSHTCGLKTNGSVACWGDNEYGESTPPAGTFAGVSAGEAHSCALRTNGTVACWGDNTEGQATPP